MADNNATDDGLETRAERIRTFIEESDGAPFGTGKTRNPNRIESICVALEQRCKESLDLRLGQLVSVLTGQGDTFVFEDTHMINELDVDLNRDFWVDRRLGQ